MKVNKESKFELLTEVEACSPGSTRSPVYVTTQVKDNQQPKDEELTLYRTFTSSVEKFPNHDCLGIRTVNDDGTVGNFKFWSFKETADRVVKIASAMKQFKIQRGSTIGIYGVNCREWMLAMQACNRLSLICVPLYDTLADDAVEYIIDHAEVSMVFLDGSKILKLATALEKTKGSVKNVIYWGKAHGTSLEKIERMKIGIEKFEGFMKMGTKKEAPADPPNPDDLCTIMYTSGTTGIPKGVMLTHKAMALNCSTLKIYFNALGRWGPGDSFLSYLPLAHSFDRTFEELMLASGIAIGYWQGDGTKLFDDLAALKSTIMIGVPRVFDRLYAAVMNDIKNANWIQRSLFQWGYHFKRRHLINGSPQSKVQMADSASPLFDRLVFHKVKEKLGGRMRFLLTGGAPIAPHTESFLKVCSCADAVQGYGLTETCAALFVALPNDPDMDTTSGLPLSYVQFRLESVPDMNYDATGDEPIGELCVQTPYTFSGYYKAKDLTSEVLDSDGWFHTGDIAAITPKGALKIVDRKKNILKLSQGEYVAVEKVEGVYKELMAVEQIWVHGDSFKDYLVAVVVPSEVYVKAWAADSNKAYNYTELCKDPNLVIDIQDLMNQKAKENHLNGFEKVKRIYLENVQFSPLNELLTPTFKMRRPQLKRRYQDVVSGLYS